MQSASAAHDDLHALAPHTYGAQVSVGGVTQAPEPSHLPAKLAVPEAHVAAPQLVAPVGAVHATGLLPSQVRGPQVGSPDAAVQAVRPLRGVPVTVLHVPTLPVSAHDWH
jgi:hypothetical protein